MIGTASFGMYDFGTLQAANDRLWSVIAARLAAAGVQNVPLALDRARPLEAIWDDPDLLLTQTCGYPWLTRWRGRLRYVATPRYRADGCEGSSHRSRIVVRRSDEAPSLTALRGRRLALNDRCSNTGMNLLRAAIAPLANARPFFAGVAETGSHKASAEAIADHVADVAAIDVVSFAHLQKIPRAYRPAQNDCLDRTVTGFAARHFGPGIGLVSSATAHRAGWRDRRRARQRKKVSYSMGSRFWIVGELSSNVC